jgi:hypothetical protein
MTERPYELHDRRDRTALKIANHTEQAAATALKGTHE